MSINVTVTRNGQYVGERDVQDVEGVVALLNTHGSTYDTPGVVTTITVTADPQPEDYEDEDFDEDESDESDDDVVELLKGIASGIGDLVSAVRNIVR